MSRVVSITKMAVLTAFWVILVGSFAAVVAALMRHDWLSSAWAVVTLSICGAMIALRKKEEKRLMFGAVVFIPYALVSLVAASASFFGSAGWSGYGTFVVFLAPVLVLAVSHALSVSDRMRRPIQPLQRNAGSRPSSDDSPASETPSSLGPRG